MQGLQAQWSRKVFQKDTPEATVEANAAALAQIDMLQKLIELDHTELNEALSDAIESNE